MQFKISQELENKMSAGQKDLIKEGIHLLEYIQDKTDLKFHDYSFLVFPFAKAYEGFIKQMLMEAGYISQADYYSDHFRLGKVLSPNLIERLGRRSVFKQVCDRIGCQLSDQIWHTWKIGRNEVFHYFPHNLRSVTLTEAQDIIANIIDTMEQVALYFKTDKSKKVSK